MIKKGTFLKFRDKKVILMSDMEPSDMVLGLVVLNIWEQCDCEDIEVLPISVLNYKDTQEKYNIYNENIVLGEAKYLCLI